MAIVARKALLPLLLTTAHGGADSLFDHQGQQPNHLRVPAETNGGKSGKSETVLYQEDFEEGTYRVTQPGIYRLGEDIDFGPQKSNDYWPPFSLWHKYPPTAYYLGFFAAITIECDDVVINLDDHTLSQSKEFYLVQRFFNAIELNDRVFVQNTGVASLNYQSTDELVKGESGQAGSIVKPKNVVVKNGIIERVSHSGIHGNGIIGLKVVDVHVRGFEVSGIQCNGCEQVRIKDCKVGPSSKEVPVLATFANARFLDFYAKTLIPHGFEREADLYKEPLMSLFDDEEISFADRPNVASSLSAIFDRLHKALTLFRSYHVNGTLPSDQDEEELLLQAKDVFSNPTGLPDGSVIYGILLNRLGMPETDENFFGAGRETKDVDIVNVEISGLHASPVEVASLMTEENTFIQGVARDVIRIFDITSDQMRSLVASFYKGNVLSDSYVALWKLSNEFYKIRVYDSTCGNFGSNATFDMNLKLYPSYQEQTCAQLGIQTDSTLTGRDVTNLQKKYFGGIQMTQAVYHWATSPTAMGLDSLLSSPASADSLRSGGRHRIVCDHDTMFHQMQGVIGLKIVEAENVRVINVKVNDLRNTADFTPWVCSHKWQIQPSGEDIKAFALSTGDPEASTVKGIELLRSEDVTIQTMDISSLVSDEGIVKAIEVIGDDNDRTDHSDDSGIKFSKVDVGDLSGAKGAQPLYITSTPLQTKGISFNSIEEIDSSLRSPRVVISYQAVNAGPPVPVNTAQTDPIAMIKAVTSLDTNDKIRAFRLEVLGFFKTHYGARFEEDANEKYGLTDIIPVMDRDGVFTDSIVSMLSLLDNNSLLYHGSNVCVSDGRGGDSSCTGKLKAPVHDFSISFVVGPSGYTFHGAFGSDQGQFSPAGNYIACGVYSFEGLSVPGRDEESNVMVKYFGECPLDLRPIKTQGLQSMYINCALESDLFGKGVATGAILYNFLDPLFVIDGVPVPKMSLYPTMIFDDIVLDPAPIDKQTSLLTHTLARIESNDIRFNFVADGTYKTRLSAVEALPYPKIHHYTHESVVLFMKRRTSLKTDEDIHQLRKDFLTRLKDEFFISAIVDADQYDDIPLDGEIDLGGGNRIVGYVVNEDANQRVLTKETEVEGIAMPGGSRLHEGGFRLVVGRSGIDTIDGRAAFGTTITQGIYVIENGSPSGDSDAEIEFYSLGLVELNSWSTSIVYQRLYSETYGEGRLLSAQPMPKVDPYGIHLKVSGALVFGNV